MSEPVFRLARPGEGPAITAFINEHFDMRLPLLNRPELYEYYFAGHGGAPHFAVAEADGRLLSAAGYIPAAKAPGADVWVSIWVAARGHNGVGLELMDALPGLLGAQVLACNNIRENTCKLYHFLGWQAERLRHYYRLGRPGAGGWTLAQPGAAEPLPVGGDLTLEPVPGAEALVFGQADRLHTRAEILGGQLFAGAVRAGVVHQIEDQVRPFALGQDAAHRGANLVKSVIADDTGADTGHRRVSLRAEYYRYTIPCLPPCRKRIQRAADKKAAPFCGKGAAIGCSVFAGVTPGWLPARRGWL